MRGRYRFGAGEIRDRSRYATYTLVRPRRQVEALGRAFQKRPASLLKFANRCKLLTLQSRVGTAGPPYLQLPCLGNPLCDNWTAFTIGAVTAQHCGRRSRNLNVQVDAIKERA